MNSTPRPATGRRRSWWSTPSRRRDEGGFAAIMLMVAGTLVGFAILMLWAVPLFVATDGQARNQTAADAAAIAAAESVHVPTAITDLIGFNGNLESLLAPLNGRADADRLAAEGGGTVVDFAQSGLEAYVEVETVMPDGKKQRSTARARLDLPSCSSAEEDAPPDPEEENEDADADEDADAEADEDADEEGDDEPPEPVKVTVWTCGGVKLNDPNEPVDIVNLINTLVSKSTAKLID